MAENQNDVAVTREFRKAAAKFATGITVVLVDTPQGLHGMTANAFMSVSLNPLTVAVSIANHTRMHQCLEDRGTRFSISVLAHDQKLLSDVFAGRMDPNDVADPFETVHGGVVIRHAAAWFCCVREDVFVSGDHTITIGRVETFDRTDRDPLIFYQGNYYLGFDFSIPDTQWRQLTDS